MNTSNTAGQQISLFADGELDHREHPDVLALLRHADAGRTWDEYHLVGDLLRSSDMAGEVCPDFAARFSARLATEPTHLHADAAPAEGPQSAVRQTASRHAALRRFAAPGAAIAATVLLTMAAVPRLTGSHQSASEATGAASMAVATSGRATLRDARIDEYLQAHQRFSPSLYTTAQYSRTPNFATETDK